MPEEGDLSNKVRLGLGRLRQIWALDRKSNRAPPPTREELANFSFYATPHGNNIPPRRGGRRQRFRA